MSSDTQQKNLIISRIKAKTISFKMNGPLCSPINKNIKVKEMEGSERENAHRPLRFELTTSCV
jgi:hypothetical protein